jgi:hypothetical protein
MSRPADEQLLAALGALADALAELGQPAMIIGGIAAIARGVPRQTIDIDATVWAEELDLGAALATLARHDIAGRIPDVESFARERQVLLLRHQASGTPLELSLAWLPFEREALARAERIDFGGVTLPVARPEDLVIFKAVAWRDRDIADIERLILLHGDAIDLDRVRRVVAEFAEVLEDPGRVARLDEIVRRARGARGQRP